MRFFVLAVLLLSLGDSRLSAQTESPSITGVSGTLSHNQTVTLTGSGFGAKSQAAPVKWDNFDNGTTGAVVGNGWGINTVISGGEPRYNTNIVRAGSSRSVRHDYVTPGNYNSSYTANIDGSVYFSFWQYYDNLGGYSVPSGDPYNNKPFQVFGTNASVPSAQAGYGIPGQSGGGGNFIDENNAAAWWYYADIPTADLEGHWYRLSCYLKQSSGAGATDGLYDCTWYRPGVRTHAAYSGPTYTRITPTYSWNVLYIGDYYRRTPPLASYKYTDDAYIDTTPARVEVCDAATWSARTWCEIQIPTLWTQGSPDRIQVTVNTGSFQTGQPAHLYIVNANGGVNALGYPITIGSTAQTENPQDTTPPAAPTGLTVQ